MFEEKGRELVWIFFVDEKDGAWLEIDDPRWFRGGNGRRWILNAMKFLKFPSLKIILPGIFKWSPELKTLDLELMLLNFSVCSGEISLCKSLYNYQQEIKPLKAVKELFKAAMLPKLYNNVSKTSSKGVNRCDNSHNLSLTTI